MTFFKLSSGTQQVFIITIGVVVAAFACSMPSCVAEMEREHTKRLEIQMQHMEKMTHTMVEQGGK